MFGLIIEALKHVFFNFFSFYLNFNLISEKKVNIFFQKIEFLKKVPECPNVQVSAVPVNSNPILLQKETLELEFPESFELSPL